jgi:polyhydroxyalkanoate synthesis regulator protein
MLREGQDVEVVDGRTGKDVTRTVLTQIIVEDSRSDEAGPPLPLLKQLVLASDRATHEFIAEHLGSTLELYQKAQQAVQTRISDARAAVAGPLEAVRALLAGLQSLPASHDRELEELRSRVKELEARVAELTKTKPRRAATRRR